MGRTIKRTDKGDYMKYAIILTLLASMAQAEDACEPTPTPAPKACCAVKTKVVYKTVTKETEKIVQVDNTRRNSVSLLAGATPTKLEGTHDNGVFHANTVYKADLGLLYQRDTSQETRLSVGVTIGGNAYVGAGYNF